MIPAVTHASNGGGTPPVLAASSRRIPGWAWLVAAMAGVLLVVLYRVEPAGQAFFPRCWLYQATGLQCPGCGATRAVHALLNGQVRESIRLNALVVPVLLLGSWSAIRAGWGWRTGRWWGNPLVNPVVLALLAGLAFGFGVGRNMAW